MFKYKSPLSRLLEGAGKAKEAETEQPKEEAADQQEPIADFNALRQALAGGNLSSDSYEESDELIPEERMPDFAEREEKAEEGEIAEAEETVAEAPAVEAEALEEEQVVTLHVAPTETAESTEEEDMLAAVAQASAETSEEIAETPAEPETPAEAEAPAEAVTAEPEPVAEAPEAPAEPVEAEQVAAESEQDTQPEPLAAPAPAEDRRSRVKTTFLGFERADTHVQDLMESAEPVAKTEAAQETFPVGWLVVTSGPGRGSSVTLTEGLMQIGRNDDQAIQLDFGDTGISRSNHAVIAYDPEDRKCYLGHGGKANLVRLNGKPVLSTIALSNGDSIRISETSIRFMAFCDDGFDWRDAD